MERKKLIWIGLFLGSIFGSFIPTLWGDSALSMTSFFTSALGSFVGIWLGWKLGS